MADDVDILTAGSLKIWSAANGILKICSKRQKTHCRFVCYDNSEQSAQKKSKVEKQHNCDIIFAGGEENADDMPEYA